jgi:hypothetical protein
VVVQERYRTGERIAIAGSTDWTRVMGYIFPVTTFAD